MRKRSVEAALLLLASVPVYAAEETMSPVVVTATRTAESIDESLASVSVIEREEIESRQALSLVDVLRGVPGITISTNGGPGKATSVFIRGANEDQVLVLIDGVKVGSATLGTTAFENVPIDQIERIEIVRGPRSSLYGSEAIGGVIQIFTRKGGGAVSPYVSLGGGSHRTYKALSGVTGGGTNARYNVSVSGINTDGFDTCRGDPLLGGCFTLEPDDDGYRNRSAAVSAGYRLRNGVELDLQVLRSRGDNDFDGTFVNESELLQQVVATKLGLSPSARWHVTLAAGRSRDESENFLNGASQSRFDTERDTASFQNDIELGASHLLTLGVDQQDDRVDSTVNFPVTSRDNTGVFAQYQGTFGAQRVWLAVRSDDNEQFGHETTGSLAWGRAVGRGTRMFLSYGTAFKAPTFNQLFFPGFGNPDLEPEKSKSLELGLNGKLTTGQWSLSLYQTIIDDLIAFDATFTPANIDEARIRGVEAAVSTQIARWILGATVTLLDPENRSAGSNRDNDLARRPKESLRIDAQRVFGRFKFGATLYGQSESFDDLANTRELAGFATLDLLIEYALHKDWTLGARVGNVFDKEFETAEFFNQDGRNIFFTLGYRPGHPGRADTATERTS